jgi:hypothetical protein
MDSLPLRRATLTYMKIAALVVLGLLPLSARAMDTLAELDGLLAHQSAESKECNKFRRKWHSMVKGGLSAESPSHVSKSQGLEALKLLEKYPERSTGSRKVWDFIVEHEADLAAQPDQKQVAARLAQVNPQCDMFSHFTHLTLLQKDVGTFSFAKKEKGKVESLVKRHLRDAGSDATMAGLGLKGRILATYVDTLYKGENASGLRERIGTWLKDYEAARAPGTASPVAEAAQAAADSEKKDADAAPATPAVSVSSVSAELGNWKRLDASYRALLAEAGL